MHPRIKCHFSHLLFRSSENGFRAIVISKKKIIYRSIGVFVFAQGIKSFLASQVWFQGVAGARTYGTDSPAMYVCIYASMYVCIDVCMYVYVFIDVWCVYIYVCVYVCVCLYVCVCMCVCMYVCIYACMRARCSSVVRAFAHGAIGRRIDPSWGEPIELFLVSASAPRLV